MLLHQKLHIVVDRKYQQATGGTMVALPAVVIVLDIH
jgi:hypothetical protein